MASIQTLVRAQLGGIQGLAEHLDRQIQGIGDVAVLLVVLFQDRQGRLSKWGVQGGGRFSGGCVMM